MADQPEFDRLRQICSTRLEAFIAETRKTELAMQQLTLPVSLAASQQFASQRNTEVVAFENYIWATVRLSDFLQQHVYIVN